VTNHSAIRSLPSVLVAIGVASLMSASGLIGLASAAAPQRATTPDGVSASVTIYPNGSVSRSGIFTISGGTYTLATGLAGSIADERNDSVLNGANHTVGNPSDPSAVYVFGAVNVTVEYFTINSKGDGITVQDSSRVRVTANGIFARDTGISVNSSFTVNVSGNSALAFTGFSAIGDTGLAVSANDFANATQDGLDVDRSLNVWVGGNDLTNASPGYAVLVVSSTEVSVVGNNLSAARNGGVLEEQVSSGNISENAIFDTVYPIALVGTLNSSVWHNTVDDRTYFGVIAEYCVGITIGDTTALSAQIAGILAAGTDGMTIVGSDFRFGAVGLQANGSIGISVRDTRLGYGNMGINLQSSENVSVSGSDLINPNYGLVAHNSTDIVIEGSNLSRASYALYLSGGDASVLVLGSNLSGEQIGAVFVANSTGITIDHSDLKGAALFGVESIGTQELTISNTQVDGSSRLPGGIGVSTSNDVGITLRNDSIRWTTHPFVDYGSRGIQIVGSDLSNETSGYYAVSLSHDAEIAVTSSNLSGATGSGLDASSVTDLALTNCQVRQTMMNGVQANIVTGLSVIGSTFDGDGSSGIYAASSTDVLASGNSANHAFYGFFLDTDVAVTITNNTATGDSSGSLASNAGAGLTVVGNNFSSNTGSGSLTISIDATLQFSLVGNDLSRDFLGALVQGTAAGSISGNEFAQDNTSFWIDGNVSARIYHNDFVQDQRWHLVDTGHTDWNATYPVGGNYWSNYTGVDLLQGPGQNLAGADGVGDTPMVLDRLNKDHYPLTAPWSQHEAVFVETGLPLRTAWGVAVNGSPRVTASNSIVVNTTVGTETTLAYAVLPVTGFTVSPIAGSVVIGAPGAASNTVRITYTALVAPRYAVVFEEAGLPPGTPWSVTMNGTTVRSVNTTSSFVLENGSYSFQVGAVAGYSVTPITGAVSVAGAPQTRTVTFSAVLYAAVVVESGLPAGTPWKAAFNGSATTAVGTTATRLLANGSYTVVPTPIAGYTVTPPTTTLKVAGGPSTLYVLYTVNTSAPPPSKSPLPTLTSAQSTTLFWGVIAVLAIVAAIGWIFAMRRRPGHPTPSAAPSELAPAAGPQPWVEAPPPPPSR
jgi:Periplasmic copper-binding protein (NosD)